MCGGGRLMFGEGEGGTEGRGLTCMAYWSEKQDGGGGVNGVRIIYSSPRRISHVLP